MEDKVIYYSNVEYDVRKDDVVCETNAAYNTVRNSVQQQLQENLTKDNHKRVKISTEASESKVSANKTNFFVLLIIMVVLFLLTLVSTALLVVSYNQSQSEKSTLQSQINKASNDITAVLTQLAIIHSNISKTRSEFNTNINALTSLLLQNTDEHTQKELASLQTQLYCGAGQWYRIAFLNMTNPSQQCPPGWREYNTSGVRACGRAPSTEGSCSRVAYTAESTVYSRVCGQVIGYQVASPDAFNGPGLDIDGVSITLLGIQHYHIWSVVAGVTENSNLYTGSNCPCSFASGLKSPSYIGNNYYCESGNPTDNWENNQFISNDPVWDGQQCEGTCCTGTNYPPWFSVQLPVPTTDMIQVSICGDESTDNEDTPIKLLEIYIQ